jgi:hypothetical protein
VRRSSSHSSRSRLCEAAWSRRAALRERGADLAPGARRRHVPDAVHRYAQRSKHCGSCGHDCRGATCEKGLCASATLGTTAVAARDLAVFGDELFFTSAVAESDRSNHVVGRVRKTGDPIVDVASPAAVLEPTAGRRRRRRDRQGDRRRHEARERLPRADGSGRHHGIAHFGSNRARPRPRGIAIGDGYVYWSNVGDRTIRRTARRITPRAGRARGRNASPRNRRSLPRARPEA